MEDNIEFIKKQMELGDKMSNHCNEEIQESRYNELIEEEKAKGYTEAEAMINVDKYIKANPDWWLLGSD